jgi:uncharacterized membrane protein YedE/YeeE
VAALRLAGLINPWIPPFAWQANLVGGFLFGIGMVVAATCVTGLFYKLGHGMLGTLVAMVTWAIGDILTYLGPLSPLREMLNADPIAAANGQSATVINLFGTTIGIVLVAITGAAIAFWLWRAEWIADGKFWSWPHLGLATGLFSGLAWLLAQAGGSDYTYGTSSVPTSVWLWITNGAALWSVWITVALLAIAPGALLAAKFSGTLWIRGETPRRYGELAVGGLLMGIGAALAGGCNLGHGLVGVPLLSLGSITTVAAMLPGVWVAHWLSIKVFGSTKATA